MLELNKYIEHTLLKQDAQKDDFIKLFGEAKKHNFWGVCINPCYIKFAKEYLNNCGVKIVSVIGFPLGANTTETKVFETKQAISDGADEIDMVINVTKIKDKEFEFLINEIKQIKQACGEHILKVIIETDLLTKDEIIEACLCACKAGADFVKTSTGFVKGGVGAKVEDVELMSQAVAPYGLQVKASGGIRERETALKMIQAGATRLGTSSGVKIVEL